MGTVCALFVSTKPATSPLPLFRHGAAASFLVSYILPTPGTRNAPPGSFDGGGGRGRRRLHWGPEGRSFPLPWFLGCRPCRFLDYSSSIVLGTPIAHPPALIIPNLLSISVVAANPRPRPSDAPPARIPVFRALSTSQFIGCSGGRVGGAEACGRRSCSIPLARGASRTAGVRVAAVWGMDDGWFVTFRPCLSGV